MEYLFEISKEHKTLPIAEIFACLKAEQIDFDVLQSNEDVLIIKTVSKEKNIQLLINRLSYTYYINNFLFSINPKLEKIKKKKIINKLPQDKSVAIKYKNRSKNIDSRPIVKQLADIYTENRKVILNNPDNEIRCLITDSKVYIGLKIAQINRSKFEVRKVQNRPFFSPISLHPRLACALVNLSSLKKDETLLDPFCGTGGILIEAGLMGIKVIGSDIEEKMIYGCKKTLDFYNIDNYKLFVSDIGEVKRHVKEVDAIVTDLPYGKSTTTKGENMKNLYNRAFQNISNLLKSGGKAVVGLSNKDLLSIGDKYLNQLEKHDFRVHKSLIRYFLVYEK